MPKEKKIQVSASIDLALYSHVSGMAYDQNRSLSEMVSILLNRAVKEALRKKKKDAKEDIPV